MRIEHHIGIFENALPIAECNKLIDYFEEMKKLNNTMTRQQLNDFKAHEKSDETLFMLEDMRVLRPMTTTATVFLTKFWECYREYASVYSVLLDVQTHGIMNMHLQRTLPGQGYHVWHFENANVMTSNRVTAFSVYLNTVEQGGETEFLHQGFRAMPKAGTILIWPPTYTHTHRGNPPLSGPKYLLTGWTEYIPN